MTTFRRTAAAVAIAAAATAGLGACSDKKEAPKAKDAWNKAQDTLNGYKSLEIKADGTENNKKVSATMKGKVNGDPEEQVGTVGDQRVDMIMIGKTSYLKANSAYWKDYLGNLGNSQLDPSKFADKWISSTQSTRSTDAGFAQLVKDLRNDSSDVNKKLLSDKATVTSDSVNGKDAWKITSEDKKVTAWVSQDDAHDPLKISGFVAAASDKTSPTYTFLSHDKDYGIKAPSGAVDAKTLLGAK